MNQIDKAMEKLSEYECTGYQCTHGTSAEHYTLTKDDLKQELTAIEQAGIEKTAEKFVSLIDGHYDNPNLAGEMEELAESLKPKRK